MYSKAVNRQVVPKERDFQRNDPLFWMPYATGLSAALFLIVLFAGESARPVRQALGIEWMVGEKRGVYVNCDKARYSQNRFCKRDYVSSFKKPQVAKPYFRHPAHDLPFSLSR